MIWIIIGMAPFTAIGLCALGMFCLAVYEEHKYHQRLRPYGENDA